MRQPATAEVRLDKHKAASCGPAGPSILPFWMSTSRLRSNFVAAEPPGTEYRDQQLRGRVWIGALYYATGIPFMLNAAPPFAEFLHARYQGIEAPPVIPLLTNPITVLLAGVGLYRLWWRPELPAAPWRCCVSRWSAMLLLFS
jgi:hypothetical protein